jgi:flagellar basal body-associated protein FliL
MKTMCQRALKKSKKIIFIRIIAGAAAGIIAAILILPYLSSNPNSNKSYFE